jgi:hypothetical protein
MMQRSGHEKRTKQLRLAIARIEHGRSTRADSKRLTIAAVAREAGVSAALIHNCYPDIAAQIRERKDKRGGNNEVSDLRARARELRAEIGDLQRKIAQLATINEVLLVENETLRKNCAGNISQLVRRQRQRT